MYVYMYIYIWYIIICHQGADVCPNEKRWCLLKVVPKSPFEACLQDIPRNLKVLFWTYNSQRPKNNKLTKPMHKPEKERPDKLETIINPTLLNQPEHR